MFISFDSLHELRDFLAFTGLSKEAAPITQPSPVTAPVAVASDATAAAIDAAVVAAAAAVAADEVKPKRTRRTKTEPVVEVEPEVEQVVEAEPVAEVEQANPFATPASPATQAVLDAPDGRTATLAGIAAMQEAPELEAAVEAPEVEADVDAEAFINARADELIASEKVSKPVEHMARCTQFIGAHSRAVYDQSFELAGLPKTIATFKAPQIARHQAALEFLSKSN